jgi:hypothetical protein
MGEPGRLVNLKETNSSDLVVKIHCALGSSYNHKKKIDFYKDLG